MAKKKCKANTPAVCLDGGLCKHVGEDCAEVSIRRFVCTRAKGHKGEHVACGVEHNMDVWSKRRGIR